MLSKVHIQKLEECHVVAKYSNNLGSPIVVDNQIYCVSENGDILKIKKTGEIEIFFTILGQPSSLAYKDVQNSFLISDFAHQSIFAREEGASMQIHNLISEYNDHAFIGPHSIEVGPFTKNIYFTDSGAFLETSIENKLGSLFVIRGDNQKLKCLTFRNLAYPAGLKVDQQEKILLVCEQGENRILKYILDQNLSGNYTVFHQFNGRVGPSAICSFNSKFYVSLFEFNDLSNLGMIAVLSINGQILQKLAVETGGEITGLFIYEEQTEKEEEVMLISESNKLYRVPLKKGEEESKMEESIVLSKP